MLASKGGTTSDPVRWQEARVAAATYNWTAAAEDIATRISRATSVAAGGAPTVDLKPTAFDVPQCDASKNGGFGGELVRQGQCQESEEGSR